MLKILPLLRKEILFDESPILLKTAPDKNWDKDWKVMAGEWKYENGALIGIETGNKGGILFSRKSFNEPVMMSFKISTVLPATRDVNAVFCAHWDTSIDYLGESYVCGLNGWYEHKCGIERNNGTFALNSGYQYVPGKEVEMVVGSIDGHCFMFVDDKLISEFYDEHPLYDGHMGFSPYCTMLKIRDIEIRKIKWRPRGQVYEPEF